MPRPANRPIARFVAAGTIAALGAAVLVMLLTGERPAPVLGDEAAPSEDADAEERSAARAPVAAAEGARPVRELTAAGRSAGARQDKLDEPPLSEEFVEIELVPLEAAPSPTPGASAALMPKGTARLVGRVVPDSASRGELAIRFVAGLDAGKEVVVQEGFAFDVGGLSPGLALVSVSHGGRGAVREARLSNRDPVKMDVDLSSTAHGNFLLRDSLTGAAVAGASLDFGGTRYESDGNGAVEIPDAVEGPSVVHAHAKAFEFRRVELRWGSLRRSQGRTFEIPLRRSAPVVVTFDGPADEDDVPVAVAVPRRQGSASVAFEKCGAVEGAKGARQVILEGIPNETELRVYLFLRSAIATPAHLDLPAQDPAAVQARSVRFVVERRRFLRGSVVQAGAPVPEARVTLESDDFAAGTAACFGEAAFARYAFPVLPCVRKEMETDERGRFRFETADLRLPARLRIEKPGLAPWVQAVPRRSLDLGAIDLAPPSAEPAGTSAIVFEFADERPRTVRLSRAEAEGPDRRITEMHLTGRRSPPVSCAEGLYGVAWTVGRVEGSTQVRVQGETVVAIGSSGEDR